MAEKGPAEQTATVMIVHEAFATVLAGLPQREGTLGQMRLSPIARALDAQRRGIAPTPRSRPARRPLPIITGHSA